MLDNNVNIDFNIINVIENFRITPENVVAQKKRKLFLKDWRLSKKMDLAER